MGERDIQHEIREALGLEHDLVLWRNNTGVFDDGRGGKIRTGLGVGSADLVGILTVELDLDGEHNIGRFFALEVKTAGGEAKRAFGREYKTKPGKLSPEQTRWLALVRTAGGFAAVVRSVQEAKEALDRARKGASE